MSAHRVAGLLATGCALLALAGPLSAQAIVIPLGDLEFGQLQAGTTETVPPTDGRRASFLMLARGSYLAQFVLPPALTSAGGGSVSLTFGPGDAIAQQRGNQTFFDPTQPFPLAGPGLQLYRFYLGGTAGPVIGAPAGNYTAVITLLIIQAGA